MFISPFLFYYLWLYTGWGFKPIIHPRISHLWLWISVKDENYSSLSLWYSLGLASRLQILYLHWLNSKFCLDAKRSYYRFNCLNCRSRIWAWLRLQILVLRLVSCMGPFIMLYSVINRNLLRPLMMTLVVRLTKKSH